MRYIKIPIPDWVYALVIVVGVVLIIATGIGTIIGLFYLTTVVPMAVFFSGLGGIVLVAAYVTVYIAVKKGEI